MANAPVLGVIGGSGVSAIPGLRDVRESVVSTPFGEPSGGITQGRLGDTELLFLARHGKGHVRAPHEINYRANVCALKRLGATHVVSISAVGSMREDIAPGHVVIVDQYIDRTRARSSTFFEEGVVAHVSLADPVCPLLSRAAAAAARRAGATVHDGGTYLCMEGPQFSTRAESRLYRNWGVSVIGMTAMPEAKLAREAELPYATIAFATDYDSWHQTEEAVTVEQILGVLRKNVHLAGQIIAELAPSLPDVTHSPATGALKYALITDPSHITPEARTRLDWLIAPYLER